MVVLKPKVLTTEGKKFLKEFAARCMCCMKANSHIFGSRAASLRPAQEEPPALAPTWSAMTREFASSFSSAVSHQVSRGSLGRTKADAIATTTVTAPWIMKSHFQPARPARPSKKCQISELENYRRWSRTHLEDSSSNQTSESRGEDVAGVQDRNPCGDFLAGVEDREDIECAGVVWSLNDSKEEACEKETREILRESSASRNNAPKRLYRRVEGQQVSLKRRAYSRAQGKSLTEQSDNDCRGLSHSGESLSPFSLTYHTS